MTDAARLLLCPATDRGWFGGRALSATEPVEVRSGASLTQAADALQEQYDSPAPGLTAVLAAYDGSCTLVRFALVEPLPPLEASSIPRTAPLLRSAEWDLTDREYRAAVEMARAHIAAGDVYVLNLTARLAGELAEPPGRCFAALLERAGADMSAFLGGMPGATPWIASVSPERFVRVRSGEHGARLVEVCPIKGTAPRGFTPVHDAEVAAALASDPKERAEHVMIVDLERNDLGVCAVPGTVHVDPLYEVVPTPYCHQLVSTVRATLRPDASFAELLAATLPCGSVTGAPKRAAMRIIDGLEAGPRGAYCGALIVAMSGELDSSVLIRTLEGTAEQPGHARWGAGCGITHDSDAAAEYLEMLLKASPVSGDGAPDVALRETMRVAFGRVPLLDRHLARLASGGAGPTLLSAVRAAVAEQVGLLGSDAPYGRLGVTVTPDGSVSAGVSAERPSLDVEGGPRLVPVVVPDLPALPAHAAKPASRRFWDRAHRTARMRGADQALLVTPDGALVDGSTASVWLLHGSRLSTPPAPPAVAGVVREVVFDAASRHGITAVEMPLTLADYWSADEVHLSNAVGGLVRARRVVGTSGAE